jgi:tetratricopeptide (TPR) repeat protein
MKSIEKFIKKYRLWWAIGIIILATVVAIVVIKIQRNYAKNPEMIPVRKDYTVEVQLTPEQEMEYETNIIEADQKIQEYFQTGQQLSGEIRIKTDPDEQLFINKAMYQKYLGRYNEAIETFQQIFTRYKDSIYALNNLALIYEEVKEYGLAIKLYQKIQEKYPQYTLDALYKMAQLYTMLGDKEAAGEEYINYEKSGWQRDEGLMEAIRQLK